MIPRCVVALTALLIAVSCGGPKLIVTATPQDVVAGAAVRVSCSLQSIRSARGDIRFSFSTDSLRTHKFSQDMAESAPVRFWTAPDAPGVYTLQVHAFEGGQELAQGTVTVTVSAPPQRELGVEFQTSPTITTGYLDSQDTTSGGNLAEFKVGLKEQWEENPHSGPTCTKITCQAGDQYCGITWAYPPNNIRGQEMGLDLSWAEEVKFWARGHRGGEKIRISVGAEPVNPHPSTLPITLARNPGSGSDLLELGIDWRQFTIHLTGDRSNVPVLFEVLVPAPGGRPLTFYLDDILYVKQNK